MVRTTEVCDYGDKIWAIPSCEKLIHKPKMRADSKPIARLRIREPRLNHLAPHTIVTLGQGEPACEPERKAVPLLGRRISEKVLKGDIQQPPLLGHGLGKSPYQRHLVIFLKNIDTLSKPVLIKKPIRYTALNNILPSRHGQGLFIGLHNMIVPLGYPSEMGKLLEDFHGAIRRSSVDDNMLEVSKGLRRY